MLPDTMLENFFGDIFLQIENRAIKCMKDSLFEYHGLPDLDVLLHCLGVPIHTWSRC